MDMAMSPDVLEPEMIVCPPEVALVLPEWLQEIVDMFAMFGFGGFF